MRSTYMTALLIQTARNDGYITNFIFKKAGLFTCKIMSFFHKFKTLLL